VVVLLAGVIGFFVGSNSAEASPTFEVFGTVALPTTPLSVTLYGMLLAAVFMAGLFAAVEFASRYDEV
jgi:prolipoprotein diacylglyceryltransferase